MKTVYLLTNNVELSESENPDVYIAKFIICDFGINKNNVCLNRETISEWIDTLKNKPLVGKLKKRSDGVIDFTGHNVKKVKTKDADGNTVIDYEFDTSAFGSFYDVGIETINGIEYIVAYCEIWKRFKNACEVIVNRINEGKLYTSWEISVEDSSQKVINGTFSKIINKGRFIGHCLLSKFTQPAYDSSGLLEMSSLDDTELLISEAMSKDFIEIESSDTSNINTEQNENKEAVMKKDLDNTTVSEELENNIAEESEDKEVKEEDENADCKKKKAEVEDESSETNSNETNTENNNEVSSLTSRDIYNQVDELCMKALDCWGYIFEIFPEENVVWYKACEWGEKSLDYYVVNYTIIDDVVSISEPQKATLTMTITEMSSTIEKLNKEISEKNDAIIKSNEIISAKEKEISELTIYKDKFEKAEQERIIAEQKAEEDRLIAEKIAKQNELKQYAISSKMIKEEEFETSEELQKMLEELDMSSIKGIIADRVIASLDNKEAETKVETSEVENKNVTTNLNNDELDMVSNFRTAFFKK